MKTLARMCLALLTFAIACSEQAAPPAPTPSAPSISIPPPKPWPAPTEGHFDRLNRLAKAMMAADKLEARSPAQLRVAACTAADGSWRCAAPKPHLLGASQQPITPISWTVPAWFVGGGSDSNDCVTSLTPCATYSEIAIHRWGTYSPALQQVTVVNVLSTLATNDYVEYLPNNLSHFSGFFQVIGTFATKVAAGTIINGAAVVPKNRSSPANGQLLEVTFSGAAIGNVAIGDILINSTHPSIALVYANIAGNEYAISQPLTQEIPGFSGGAEVDTWAQTDTVTIVTVPQITVGRVAGPPFSVLGHVEVLNPLGSSNVYNDTDVIEGRQTGFVVPERKDTSEVGFLNVDIHGGGNGRYQAGSVFIDAGQVRTSSFNLGPGSTLSNDAILGGSGGPTYAQSMVQAGANTFYIDTTAVLLIWTGASTFGGPGQVWGPGSFELGGNATLNFPANGGATTFLNQGGAAGFMTLGGGITTALTLDTTADPVIVRGPRSLTASNLDTAVGGGGFKQTSGNVNALSIQSSAVIQSGSL